MPLEHVIYIPLVLFVGAGFGFLLGARSARRVLEREAQARRE